MTLINGVEILPHETVDDLQINGYRIIQSNLGFKYGTDAVLLANFAVANKGERVADFCTGSGIIPILLAANTHAAFIAGIEIQSEIAGMAERSVLLNNLNEKIEIYEGDIKNAHTILYKQKFDVVTCNPPYMSGGAGLLNSADTKAVSRHEILCTLEDVLRSAAQVLRYGGRLYMIHRADRLADIIQISRQHKLEPKAIRLVYPSPDKKANLVLYAASLGGGVQLDCLPPIGCWYSEVRNWNC